MSKIGIILEKKYRNYPNWKYGFAPDGDYPEYHTTDNSYNSENYVYGMIRDLLHLYELDNDNYGSYKWNPLGEYIRPGDTVILKPNLVYHENGIKEFGMDCLITNVFIVSAVIDFVSLALKDEGTIIIGDAPLQSCLFDILVEENGYANLIDFQRERLSSGINIELIDFRNTKTYFKDGVLYPQDVLPFEDMGVIVDLAGESAFSGCSEDRINRLRVTDFDPDILQKHHNETKHEYKISKSVLEADVIINLPKPKTHRKAGITAALKNMVGINSNKEYIPHHTLGSIEEGGDAYLHKNSVLAKVNEVLDEKNRLNSTEDIEKTKALFHEYIDMLNREKQNGNERYWEGSWFGNDTIWRSVIDFNRIVQYSDSFGKLKDTVQRKYLAISDMVICGEGEGPLEPSPKPLGMLMIGEDPLAMDRVICSVMGFDYKKIPMLRSEILYKGKYAISNKEEVNIVSNDKRLLNKNVEDLLKLHLFSFIPTKGWESKLGNIEKELFIENLKNDEHEIIIFGAGNYGVDMCKYLVENGAAERIACFFDNDESKWGSTIAGKYSCERPHAVDGKYLCLICAKDKTVDLIMKDAKNLKFSSIYVWREKNN